MAAPYGAQPERNQEATVYVGNLDTQVTEAILWELFVQSGPIVNVHIPKDKITGTHQGYGFVEFRSEDDADYGIKIMNMIKLFGKPIRVNKSSQDKRNLDIGANLFVGNLDTEVDEKLLYDTFSAFGVIVTTPKIMRDPDSGGSRGFGFVSFESFEAADASIEAMNGQYLCGKPISVTYAYKKDSKGERHGSLAERILAANNPNKSLRPHTIFSSGPNAMPLAPPPFPGMGGAPPAFPGYGAPPPFPGAGGFPPPFPGAMGGFPPPFPGH